MRCSEVNGLEPIAIAFEADDVGARRATTTSSPPYTQNCYSPAENTIHLV
jgi:hypothetical protein